MIDDLKNNIKKEKKILADIIAIVKDLQTKSDSEKRNYVQTINLLVKQLEVLNDSVPSLLEEVTLFKSLPSATQDNLNRTKYIGSPSIEMTPLNKEDKNAFIKELNLHDLNIKKSDQNDKEKQDIKPSEWARISNQLFSGLSARLSSPLKDVGEDLKKANIRFLLSTYISISLFISSLIFVASLIFFIFLIILNLSYITLIWIPFFLFFGALGFFYVYPSIEKGSFKKNMEQELPFASIQMSAIAGSEVAPYKIFKIISMSKEYPNLSIEIRKMINQVDVYGLDLVTALKNAAKATSSEKLAELYAGLATNISTGGSLKEYLSKKSENMLLDYKLEREKATEISGTFMNIYISIVIVAPLILMILFIIMNVGSLGVSLSITWITIIMITTIILINIIFLIVLDIKQPKT